MRQLALFFIAVAGFRSCVKTNFRDYLRCYGCSKVEWKMKLLWSITRTQKINRLGRRRRTYNKKVTYGSLLICALANKTNWKMVYFMLFFFQNAALKFLRWTNRWHKLQIDYGEIKSLQTKFIPKIGLLDLINTFFEKSPWEYLQ